MRLQAEFLKAPRRSLLFAGAACLLAHMCDAAAFAQNRNGSEAPVTLLSPPIEPGVTLLSAPMELAGDWGRMLPYAADQVVELMRHSCLDGVRLLSDRQPTRLRVDEHASGPPAVWLHPDGSSTAWIIVDIGQRAWSQLAYQFGHELGHVMANSWQPHAKPAAPVPMAGGGNRGGVFAPWPGPPGSELEAKSALRRRQRVPATRSPNIAGTSSNAMASLPPSKGPLAISARGLPATASRSNPEAVSISSRRRRRRSFLLNTSGRPSASRQWAH